MPAALKVALGDRLANREAIVREAHVLRARIQDGVAQFLALVEMPGGGVGLLITFEAGRSLESILEEGPLHPNDVMALGRRLFGVLAALHADESTPRASSAALPQVVHGDIKPGNIIVPLDARGRPDYHQATLIDFGVARLQQRLAGAFSTDEVLGGTVGFMPIGHLVRGASPSSDVFAVTAVLYECLCARAPWTASKHDSETEIARMWALERLMEAVPPSPLGWRDVPPWRHTRGWNEFFTATFSRGDTERIPSAARALEGLEAVRRDRLFALSVAAVVLAVASVFGLWMRFRYCPRGLVRCDGSCVDRARDVGHCGACGVHCGEGERCVAGRCALSCPRRETRCGASCVDMLSDRANCGACGNHCAEGSVCAAGACKASCGGGQSNCEGVCRDLRTDRAHCGACGRACPGGQLCAEGECVATCATGFTACGGRCFNLDNDREHCGRCGARCAAGQLCAHGRCETSCSSDLANCGGTCRDLRVDRGHCGVCGRACAEGEDCRVGRCVRECPPGLGLCAERCRDLAVDSENCGACGVRCGEGDRCVRGGCTISCGHGASNCAGGCRDLQRDSENCGACGASCGAGQRCEQGRCALTCAVGLTPCAGTCRDLARDSSSCGACGVACGSGERCEASRCALTCAPGTTRCGERCAALSSDNEQCGRCGRRCGADETCRQGECERIRAPRPSLAPALTPVAPGAGVTAVPSVPPAPQGDRVLAPPPSALSAPGLSGIVVPRRRLQLQALRDGGA